MIQFLVSAARNVKTILRTDANAQLCVFVWGPHPAGPQTCQTKPIRRTLQRRQQINTDLCSVGTVRRVSIIYCKRRGEIHSCPTCRQSVSQSAESGTPRTRSRDSCNRADSGPNNARFTQMPRGKCGQHSGRSEVAFLVGPTLVVLLRSLCQALASAIRQQRWAR